MFGTDEVITKDGETVPALYREVVIVCFVSYDGADIYGKNSVIKKNDFLNFMKRQRSAVIYRVTPIFRGDCYVITSLADAKALKEDAERKEIILNDFWEAHHKKTAMA